MTHRRVVPLLVLSLLVAACASDDESGSATAGDTVTSAGTDDTVAPTETDAAADTTPSDTTPSDTEPADGESADAGEGDGADAGADPEVAVTVEPSPYIGLAAAVTVTSDQPMSVSLSASGPDHQVETPRTAAVANEHVIPLVGMRADATYAIDATFYDESGAMAMEVTDAGEFTTDPLPPWFGDHEVTVDTDRAAPGYTLIEFDNLGIPEGARSSQTLVAYDHEGEVVWYYQNTGAIGGVEPTAEGTFLNFYWPFGIREIDLLGNLVGHWRPLPADASDEEVNTATVVEGVDPEQVDFQGGLDSLDGNPGDISPLPIRAEWIDLIGVHHESWPMPNGNILTLSTTVHELTPEQRATFCPDDPAPFNAISDIAVEFERDGTVVRTWDLWDVIDIEEHPGRELCIDAGIFAGTNTRDWTHANSAIYDPERDAIIVSSRHTNQIVAFDHLDEEGPQSQLRWILGDGATMPLDGEQTYYQHAVEVNDDGSLVVYDNGNFRPGTDPADPDNPPYSRAVIYEVDDSSDDPTDWSATQRWENIDVEENGKLAYSTFISDADVLSNGNVLVTHGGIGTFPPTREDPLHILIREVVPEGESGGDVVWELKSEPNSEAFWLTYRSERIESFYFGPDWAS